MPALGALSLGKLAAEKAAGTGTCEARRGRALGDYPGQNFIYVHFEPRHQEIRPQLEVG
jgi:hypothetical protein